MGCGYAGDYGGERVGRRDEDRGHYSEGAGGGDSEHQRRVAPVSSNAWTKGKPSSLGGPQKPIILKRKVEEESPVSPQVHWQ